RAAPGAAGRVCPAVEPLPVLLGECARSAVASRCGRPSLPPASVPGRRAAPGATGRACPVGEPLPVLLGECARSAVASRCGRPSLPPASVLFGALSFGARPPQGPPARGGPPR